MIRLEDLFIVFNRNTSLERIALRGVNCTINDGEIVSVVGNSGSGRSTLLQFLAGHIQATFGRLWLDKLDITNYPLKEKSKYFSSVFYDADAVTAKHLTVAENLVIANLRNQPKKLFKKAVTNEVRHQIYEQLKELDFMGMEDLVDAKVESISRAHRQVLGLLMSVIKGSRVLLIDEHSTGLDKESSRALLQVTEKIIRSRNLTTIMAVSDPKFALEVSDRAIVLSYGQVILNLSGEKKKKMKIEDLFASYNIVPPINDKNIPY